MKKRCALAAALALGSFFPSFDARADEGMWLFSNPPTRQIKEKYGFEATPEFLENLQKSCVRFGSGGSASFVSSNGLIMTNHHVALSTLASLSNKEQDYVANGFRAEKLEDEIKCPGLRLIVLQEIVDVTEQVETALAGAANAAEAETIRKETFAKIQAAANAEKGLSCEVVTLYQGGLYHLYCYKELSDVRLVFAPEESVGFFGGDPDNFEYPRYNLDVTFFRAYENDAPMKTERFLKWSENGACDGELVFVSGHPARTNRFNTVADLQYQRDVYYPHMMSKYRRREVAYQIFGSENDENARRIATSLFRVQNSRKNRGGILNGLQTKGLMQKKIDAENELRKLAADKGLIDAANDPWKEIETIMAGWRGRFVAYDLLEANEAFTSATVSKARGIVRYVVEMAKPEAERLPAYRGDALEGTRNALLAPVSAGAADIETLTLSDSLSMLYEYSKPVDGGRALDSVVIPQADFDAIFDGASPKSRATQIVKNTTLKNRGCCEKLMSGSLNDLQKSTDPAIRLALAVEPTARSLRDYYETEVAEPSRAAYAKIAKARFAVYGTEVYPDATFTLRLSYGKVAGYTEEDGTQVPFETKVSGAYEHAREHNFADPFDLAKSWLDAEAAGKAPMDAPINFVTTNDIIGGNSGSPAVNSKGEVVGLIFDGNIESLVSNFTYEDEISRAVLVHSTGIREATRHIYNMPRLADELGK